MNMRILGRDKQDETDNGHDTEEHHRGSAFLDSISVVSSSDGGETAENVGRDGHKLRLVVRISHILDNSREEKRDGIERGEDTLKVRS